MRLRVLDAGAARLMVVPVSNSGSAPIAFSHASVESLVLEGGDALDWLQRTLTADILAHVGGVCRSLCLDRLGKIHAEVLCFLGSEPIELAVIGGERDALAEHLDRHVIMEDVVVRKDDAMLHSVHGATTDVVLSRVRALRGARSGGVPWLASHDVVALLPRGGELEWQAFLEEAGIRTGNEREWENHRIESGIPRFGRDYDERDTPSCLGLVGPMVSLTKGCYLGQEVVCKTSMLGRVREQITRFRFELPPVSGADVRLTGTDATIGRLSSVADATDSGQAWAMGRVKTSALESRAKVTAGGVFGEIWPRTDSSEC